MSTQPNHLQKVASIKGAILPTVEIDDAIELTEVAEIFKRLNSTGTRVQQADIYLGVVASRNPGWVNQNFIKFMDEMDNQGFEIEPAFLFRSFTAIGAEKSRFRDIGKEFWENLDNSKEWGHTKKALQSVCQGLRQFGIINSDLALSLNAVVAAAVYRAQFPMGSFGPFLAWMLNALRACLRSLQYVKLRLLPEGVIMSHSYSSDISREQFARILPYLESARRRTKPRTVDLYDVFCGVLYLLKSGCQWRMLPADFPDWRTCYKYFRQWSERPDPAKYSILEQVLKKIGWHSPAKQWSEKTDQLLYRGLPERQEHRQRREQGL